MHVSVAFTVNPFLFSILPACVYLFIASLADDHKLSPGVLKLNLTGHNNPRVSFMAIDVKVCLARHFALWHW